ncbi:hypothetical protein [Haliangium sp.]|uniref:hypothetical protein n=1 Tax=Haliangium sp. TaxID=2663208 RepID=UPI003D0B9D9A
MQGIATDDISGISSAHFQDRIQSRALPGDLLGFVLDYGTGFHRRGLIHYTIVVKDLPPPIRRDERVKRAMDWIVLASGEGVLVTCYRRKHALRYLRRKPKRRLSCDRRPTRIH